MNTVERVDLSDDEVDAICAGLKQNAAKVRYLRGLGVTVERKPNGRPLVRRVDWNRSAGTQHNALPPTSPRWSVQP